MVRGFGLTAIRESPRGSFRHEWLSLFRAFAGAFVFAIPLLYTMEMWTLGITAELWKLFTMLVLAVLVSFVITFYSGFKEHSTWRDSLEQAIESAAIGLVAATVILLVLDRISLSDPLHKVVGNIIIQALPLAIGASVANSLFHRASDGSREDNDSEQPKAGSGFLNDAGATIMGSMLIAFGIAPTDEVKLLSAELGFVHLSAIVVLSLVLSFGIVFASGFDGTPGSGPFQSPVTETLFSYVLSLATAAGVLYLLGINYAELPLSMILAVIIVLGLPATIGGAAGRLLL